MSDELENDSVPVGDQSQRPIVTPSEKSATVSFSAYVGLNEAARLTGVHKTTITRDVKAGRLSYTTDERGNKRYQVADIDRLYHISANGATTETSSATGNNDRLRPHVATDTPTPENVELAVLKERLAAREDVIRRLENQVEDLRNDKRLLQGQIDVTTRLLEAKKEPTQSETENPPSKLSWWRKLFQ